MNKAKNIEVILITAFFVASFFVIKTALARSTVRGAAWWGTQYQYLYMDCLDDVTGDQLDKTGNLTDPGFKFYSVPCSNLVHHVSIENNGNLSGAAWNYSKGLVSFNATSTPPDNYAFNVNCPGPLPKECNLANNCSACYNETTQKIYGWGRVLADSSWVLMDNPATATLTPLALQSWNQDNSVFGGYNIKPGDFVGYATNNGTELSFNCKSEWTGSSFDNCLERNYKVYISNLQVGQMSAPNWNYSDACTGGARKIVFKWQPKSGYDASGNYTQTAYRVIVNTSDSTSSPIFDSGKISGSALQYICPGALCAWTPSYNTVYYWWIQLWDGSDQPTEFYQFGNNDGHQGALYDDDTNTPEDANLKTFTTYVHEFPNPFFVWTPLDPLVRESTEFVSNYSSDWSSPDNPPRSSYSPFAYLWTTTDPVNDIISNPTQASTSIEFYRKGTSTITFKVTDFNNYFCSTSTTFKINYGLPVWREVRAEQYGE